MAYNEHLAERIRRNVMEKHIHFEEKEMMGGLCFLVNDKLCIGIVKENLMARVGEHLQKENAGKHGCRPMDFTGRPMKGFVFVSPEGIDRESDLEHWIDLCIQFNPLAKSSKKKKRG